MNKLNLKYSYLLFSLSLVIQTFFYSDLNAKTQVLHNQGTALSGEYIIGSVPSDYLDLETALNEITFDGISAPVQLLLKPGTYSFHSTLSSFNRIGSPNDVLLISSQDPMNKAILQYDAATVADNWLLKLDDVNFVDITNLVFEAIGTNDLSNIIAIENESSDININNNNFNSYHIDFSANALDGTSIVSLMPSHLSNINISNNHFESGNGGIRLSGVLNNFSNNIVISENSFNEQKSVGAFYSIFISLGDGIEIHKNNIISHQNQGKGVRLFKNEDVILSSNQVIMLGGGNGSSGIEIEQANFNSPDKDFLIKNNFIVATVKILSLSAFSNNVKIYHNTLLASGVLSCCSPISQALFVSENFTNNIEIHNNIIISSINTDNGYAMKIEDSQSIASSENNVFHGLSSHLLSVDGVDFTTLVDYQAGTVFDAQSLTKQIDFINQDNGNLHLLQYDDPDLYITRHPDVIYDVDGETRSELQTILGADDLDWEIIFSNGFE